MQIDEYIGCPTFGIQLPSDRQQCAAKLMLFGKYERLVHTGENPVAVNEQLRGFCIAAIEGEAYCQLIRSIGNGFCTMIDIRRYETNGSGMHRNIAVTVSFQNFQRYFAVDYC